MIYRSIIILGVLFLSVTGIADERDRYIHITGEVVNGTNLYKVESRGLLEALYYAGGFTRDSALKRIQIYSNRIRKAEIDVKEIIDSNGPDVWIPPGWSIGVLGAYFGTLGSSYNDKLARYVESKMHGENKIYNMKLKALYDLEKQQVIKDKKP